MTQHYNLTLAKCLTITLGLTPQVMHYFFQQLQQQFSKQTLNVRNYVSELRLTTEK